VDENALEGSFEWDGASMPNLDALYGPLRDASWGPRHACGVSKEGEVYCVGDRRAGQVGRLPDPDFRREPVEVPKALYQAKR
jgi:hypothetical protein